MILLLKNNFSINLVILSVFDNLKLGKILDFLLRYYKCSIKSFDYT